MTGRATLFWLLTVAGVIMAVVGLSVADARVRLVLIAFGAAMFGGSLAFFLIRSNP